MLSMRIIYYTLLICNKVLFFFPLQQCFPVMKAADFKMLQDLLLTGIEIQKVRGEKKKKKRISFALLEMCS